MCTRAFLRIPIQEKNCSGSILNHADVLAFSRDLQGSEQETMTLCQPAAHLFIKPSFSRDCARGNAAAGSALVWVLSLFNFSSCLSFSAEALNLP